MPEQLEAVLIAGSGRSPSVQHAIGVSTPETVVVLEVADARWIVCSSILRPHVENHALGSRGAKTTVLSYEEAGFGDALSRGVAPDSKFAAALASFCNKTAPAAALLVPPDLPIELANGLAHSGIAHRVNRELFESRRRRKSPAELELLREAQRAAETAMTAVRDEMRSNLGATADELRRLAWHVLIDHGCAPASKLTIAPGPQSAGLAEAGSGLVQDGEPVLVDVYPRHLANGYWGDITRTFCRGRPSQALTNMHQTVCHVLSETKRILRPGVECAEVARFAHGLFEAAGYDIGDARGETPGTFPHILGHGLGLDLHEPPFLDSSEHARLAAGDVITVEPGLYKPGFGGVRVEDVVAITETGHELVTDFAYDLEI